MVNGTNQQRIGKLVEEHICDVEHLKPNRRQQKIGYYDAYNKYDIFEIKAISKRNNRATIYMKNHIQLLSSNGEYIFVKYNLINKDKGLSLITDIEILDTIKISAQEVNDLIIRYGNPYQRNYRGHIKKYQRLAWGFLVD